MNRSPVIPKTISPEEKFLVAVRMIFREHAMAIDDLQTQNKALEARIKALEDLHART